LTLCGLLLIPMFAVTGAAVRLFHEKQTNIAETWRTAGEVNLQAGQAAAAIEDFRNALSYVPESLQLQLQLADALAEQGQLDEAQNYLSSLRSADAEYSPVNLALARVAAQRGDVEAATRYYHDAMYGHWPKEAHANRFAARKELIEFLLGNKRQDAARAESLSMAADNPADPEIRAQAAEFLFQAGDAQDALAEYERVLGMSPENAEALAGSGKAALALGDYPEAERYFAKAIERGIKDPEIEMDRGISEEAAEIDPFEAQLSDKERRKRVLRLFAAAEKRADGILGRQARFDLGDEGAERRRLHARVRSREAAAGIDHVDGDAGLADHLAHHRESAPPGQRIEALRTHVEADPQPRGQRVRGELPKNLSLRELIRNPDWEAKARNWSLDVEKAASSRCGPGTITDRAIAMIAQQHKEN
jgi:tetratricopeptide (TPR) repeat protein